MQSIQSLTIIIAVLAFTAQNEVDFTLRGKMRGNNPFSFSWELAPCGPDVTCPSIELTQADSLANSVIAEAISADSPTKPNFKFVIATIVDVNTKTSKFEFSRVQEYPVEMTELSQWQVTKTSEEKMGTTKFSYAFRLKVNDNKLQFGVLAYPTRISLDAEDRIEIVLNILRVKKVWGNNLAYALFKPRDAEGLFTTFNNGAKIHSLIALNDWTPSSGLRVAGSFSTTASKPDFRILHLSLSMSPVVNAPDMFLLNNQIASAVSDEASSTAYNLLNLADQLNLLLFHTTRQWVANRAHCSRPNGPLGQLELKVEFETPEERTLKETNCPPFTGRLQAEDLAWHNSWNFFKKLFYSSGFSIDILEHKTLFCSRIGGFDLFNGFEGLKCLRAEKNGLFVLVHEQAFGSASEVELQCALSQEPSDDQKHVYLKLKGLTKSDQKLTV